MAARLLLVVPFAASAVGAPSPVLLALYDSNNLASDGSGAAPYRTSPSFLLFTLVSLLLGVFLLVAGKRGWRLTTGIGAGLVLELVTWVIIVNTLGRDGFSSSSTARTDIIIWAITTVAGVLGVAAGAFFWRIGLAAFAATAGLSLSFSIVMMGDNDLTPVARWIIIGVLTAAAVILLPFFQRTFGLALASSLTGSFLLFLGIDLLANQVSGMSLGLRYMLDGNNLHAPFLRQYSPPVLTRVLLALSWCLAIIATVFQTWVYKEPFIRTPVHLLEVGTRTHGSRNSPTSPEPPLLTPPGLTSMSERDSVTSRMNRRYQLSGEDEKGSPDGSTPEDGHRKDFTDMTSPDEPPSRPASVVSTEFANGLRSRPPTFFDLPLSTPPAPPVPISEPPMSEATTFVTQIVPIMGVGAAAAPPAVVAAPATPERKSSGSSRASGSSWRKPVPSLQVDDSSEPTATQDLPRAVPLPDSHGIFTDKDRIEQTFSGGLQSGRDVSIAPTASTPSSGDISTILGGKLAQFGQTPPPPPIRQDSFPTEPRLSFDESEAPSAAIRGDRLAAEDVPLAINVDDSSKHRSCPLIVAGSEVGSEQETLDLPRSMTNSDAARTFNTAKSTASFRTAASQTAGSTTDQERMETPDLVQDDETVTSLASPVVRSPSPRLNPGFVKRSEEEQERELRARS